MLANLVAASVLVVMAIKVLAILYGWYVLAMFFLRRKREFRENLGPFFYAVVGILLGGLVLDFVVHMLSTVVFWDLPQEWTLSKRIERYRSGSKWTGSYQRRWADIICQRWLNPYNWKPGEPHC